MATASVIDARPIAGDMALAGPWARYFARSIDLMWPAWAVMLGTSALGLEFTKVELAPGIATVVLGIAALSLSVLLLLLIDAAVTVGFGGSPGKLLLGIRVVRVDRQPLDLGLMMRRAVGIWRHGFWFSIPIAHAIAQIRWWFRVDDGELTTWDLACGTRVVGSSSDWRIALGAVIVFGVPLLSIDWKPGFAPLPLSSELAVKEIAARANHQVPRMIDRTTRFDGAEAGIERVTFQYTLTNGAVFRPPHGDPLRRHLETIVHPRALAAYCARDGMAAAGAYTKLVYRDPWGADIGALGFEPDDCPQGGR